MDFRAIRAGVPNNLAKVIPLDEQNHYYLSNRSNFCSSHGRDRIFDS